MAELFAELTTELFDEFLDELSIELETDTELDFEEDPIPGELLDTPTVLLVEFKTEDLEEPALELSLLPPQAASRLRVTVITTEITHRF